VASPRFRIAVVVVVAGFAFPTSWRREEEEYDDHERTSRRRGVAAVVVGAAVSGHPCRGKLT
jgi:uncharacterized protein YjeT (DUF2065 family)